MIKVLSVLNKNNKNKFVIDGFNAGFVSNGCYISECDYRELCIDDIKRFKPDMIFGYDYGVFMSDDEELKKYILSRKDDIKIVNYFADEPDDKLSYMDRPSLYKEFKKSGAISFVWDKGVTSKLPNSHYLPLGVNVKAYRIEPVSKQYEISFVGRPLTRKRQEALAAIIKNFGDKLNIFSYERHFLQSLDDMKNTMLLNEEEMELYKNAYRGFLRTQKEVAEVYQSSKINVNITLQGTTGLNYRIYEACASNGFLITDEVEDLSKNFDISRDLESYKNEEELVDKISFYLKNQSIARRIADNGYVKTAKKHTFTARANMLLGAIGLK